MTDTPIEYTEPCWQPATERRTGPPATVPRVAVGTVIGTQATQSSPRWTTLNERLDSATVTLRHGLRELRALGAALDASDTLIEQSAFLFRRAADEEVLAGYSLEAMAAACIHVTARTNKRPFPLGQVVSVSPVEQDQITTAYSRLVREFELRVAPPLPVEFIPRIVSEADLSQAVRQRAELLSDQLREGDAHIGQSPPGFAAAIIYQAAIKCDNEITQAELASAACVSVVTVSRQWGEIQKRIG